jgi:hypothetical protein
MDYENPWLLNEQIFTSEMIAAHVGFVYKITNLHDGRFYIGKKLFTRAGRKQVKGKKKKIRVESDWKKYYSSSEELNADVQKLGIHKFRREILRLCKSRGELNYFEAKYQFSMDALESDNFYNNLIMVRVHRSHLKFLKT